MSKKRSLLEGRRIKKVITFLVLKRVTPSVTALGDTNLNDATGCNNRKLTWMLSLNYYLILLKVSYIYTDVNMCL